MGASLQMLLAMTEERNEKSAKGKKHDLLPVSESCSGNCLLQHS
jgi:hypothetical protein